MAKTSYQSLFYGVELRRDYPLPVVALQGRKMAMVARIYELRKSEFAREEKARVLTKHSRPAKARPAIQSQAKSLDKSDGQPPKKSPTAKRRGKKP